MRKTFFIVITIFIILFLNTSCISKDVEYYLLGDIGSNNMDSSALEHYREELINSGFLVSKILKKNFLLRRVILIVISVMIIIKTNYIMVIGS